MKKLLVFLICMMMAVAVVPASEVHAAKAKPKLSVKSKTLTVGKTYKIKLKNSGSKVKWKVRGSSGDQQWSRLCKA